MGENRFCGRGDRNNHAAVTLATTPGISRCVAACCQRAGRAGSDDTRGGSMAFGVRASSTRIGRGSELVVRSAAAPDRLQPARGLRTPQRMVWVAPRCAERVISLIARDDR